MQAVSLNLFPFFAYLPVIRHIILFTSLLRRRTRKIRLVGCLINMETGGGLFMNMISKSSKWRVCFFKLALVNLIFPMISSVHGYAVASIAAESSALGIQNPVRDNITRIDTEIPNAFAYEQIGSWYYWKIKPNDSPIIKEQPRPAPQSCDECSFGAPLTVFNGWPEKLSNAGIFPYLIKHPSIESSKYGEFCDFVTEWYKTTCAIVYYSSDGDSKIIGTGSLIRKNLVATARHNFENIPRERLFVRFFNYGVQSTRNPNYLKIHENYLDVPVAHKYRAQNGLDAGCLRISALQDKNLLSIYARILPIQKDLFDGPLSEGQYAMFHFSGGRPQISLGEIERSGSESNLHDEISIQAGPGASGAAVIQKCFDRVIGGGTSIYRIVNDGCVDRRIINFSRFHGAQNGAIDKISAPYFYDSNFQVMPSEVLEESGYEFLRWRDDTHIGRRGANGGASKPRFSVYNVDLNHTAHHIIPIDDMLYLWEYLHHLDEETRIEIRNQINSDARKFAKKQKRRLGPQEIESAKNRFAQLCNEKIRTRYHGFHVVLADLCPSFYDDHEKKELKDKSGFAWSLWNLFKGWNLEHRADDPTRVAAELHLPDFSEKTRPNGFDTDLWRCIKSLNEQIQILKKSRVRAEADERQLYQSLCALRGTWLSFTESNQVIYGFDPDEWIVMGRKNGHDIYKVKD